MVWWHVNAIVPDTTDVCECNGVFGVVVASFLRLPAFGEVVVFYTCVERREKCVESGVRGSASGMVVTTVIECAGCRRYHAMAVRNLCAWCAKIM